MMKVVHDPPRAIPLSPMWWPLICQRHRPASFQFAACFALHQHGEPSLDSRQFRLLPSQNIREFLDRAGEMGDLFFQVSYICHGHYQRPRRAFCKSRAMSFLAKMKMGAGSHCHSALLL